MGVFVQYHLVGERSLLIVAKVFYNQGTLTTLSEEWRECPPLTITVVRLRPLSRYHLDDLAQVVILLGCH